MQRAESLSEVGRLSVTLLRSQNASSEQTPTGNAGGANHLALCIPYLGPLTEAYVVARQRQLKGAVERGPVIGGAG